MFNGFIRALTDPVFGALIVGYLYAHEQVQGYNLCWELRHEFLGCIFEIRAGLNAWQQLQCDLQWEASLRAPITWRLPRSARWAERAADPDGDSCASERS